MGWPSPETITAYAALLTAVQWPLVALVIGIFFRHHVGRLLSRITSAKIFGNELTLDKELDKLQEQVASRSANDSPDTSDKSADKSGTEPHISQASDERGREDLLEAFSQEEREVIETLSVSPTAAVMLISSLIESVLRDIVSNRGIEVRPPASVPMLLGHLSRTGYLDREAAASVQEFWRIRNRVVHGQHVPQHEVIRSADIGLSIYRNLMPPLFESRLDRQIRDLAREITDEE